MQNTIVGSNKKKQLKAVNTTGSCKKHECPNIRMSEEAREILFLSSYCMVLFL